MPSPYIPSLLAISHLAMALKFFILAAVLAVANAGYLGGYAAPAAVAYGAAPVAYGAAPVAYGGAYHGAVTSPALVSQHANILRTPGNLGQVSTYSKTINTPYSSVSKSDVRVSNDALAYHHAPAVAAYAAPVAHGYAAPAYAHGYAAPALAHGYAAPALAARAYAAPAVAAHGLLGVAYSAAPAVAHMTYSNGLGLNYAW